MRTPKITESQIQEGIKAGLSDSQIAKMYGVTQGGIAPRCKKLRASLTAQEEPDPEPQGPPRSTVAWKDLRKDMRVLLGKKRFVVSATESTAGVNNCVLMSMGGSYIPLNREEFEARGYAPLPEGDPQGAPVIEYKLESVTKAEPKYEPKTETVFVKKPGTAINKETCVVNEMASHHIRPETAIINANPKLLRESEAQKPEAKEPDEIIHYIKIPAHYPKQASESVKWVYRAEHEMVKPASDPYESLIMAKAREDVNRFKQVRSEIQKRLNAADHIPIEILNDYEKLIQAAGR